jgi:DNA-binding PadR family transcriptional regulator
LGHQVKTKDIASDMSRLIVLSMLFREPMHGYQIMEELEMRMGKRVSPALVYPFLRQLEGRKLLRHERVRIGRKTKKVYELTTSGKRFCMNIFKRVAAMVSQAIEPTLDTCAHCGCKVYQGGYVEEVDGKKTMFCCVHCAQTYLRDRAEA